MPGHVVVLFADERDVGGREPRGEDVHVDQGAAGAVDDAVRGRGGSCASAARACATMTAAAASSVRRRRETRGASSHHSYFLCSSTGVAPRRTRRLIISTKTEKPIAK